MSADDKPKLVRCEACRGTGQAAGVDRGPFAPGDCEPCASTGWVDEATGRRERQPDPATGADDKPTLAERRDDLMEQAQDKFSWKAPLEVCDFQSELLAMVRDQASALEAYEAKIAALTAENATLRDLIEDLATTPFVDGINYRARLRGFSDRARAALRQEGKP